MCQYGALENTFEVGQFVDLNDAKSLKPITLIEASKLYFWGFTTERTCNGRGKCKKIYPLKRKNVFFFN